MSIVTLPLRMTNKAGNETTAIARFRHSPSLSQIEDWANGWTRNGWKISMFNAQINCYYTIDSSKYPKGIQEFLDDWGYSLEGVSREDLIRLNASLMMSAATGIKLLDFWKQYPELLPCRIKPFVNNYRLDILDRQTLLALSGEIMKVIEASEWEEFSLSEAVKLAQLKESYSQALIEKRDHDLSQILFNASQIISSGHDLDDLEDFEVGNIIELAHFAQLQQPIG